MPNRSEYQPLAQSIDEEEEEDVVEGLAPPAPVSPSRRMRRLHRPGNIDLSKLDSAFKRYESHALCLGHTARSAAYFFQGGRNPLLRR